MDFLTIFLTLIAVILTLLLVVYLQKFRHWKRQNITLINVFQFVKNTKKMQLYQVIHEIYQQMCAENQPCRVLEAPMLSVVIVQDQEAVRDVLITQFQNFSDRGLYANPHEPLLGHLGRAEYQKWKLLRKKLSSAFSPAKLKFIFPSIRKVAEQFVDVLREGIANSDGIIEMNDLCARFAVDVIGNVAFGIECHSLKDPQSQFRFLGHKAIQEHLRPLYDTFAAKYTKIATFLNYKYHGKETTKFFADIVKNTVEHREKYKVKRGDFMDILIELKNDRTDGAEVMLNVENMVGHVFFFFVAGYISTSTALCEALYELAKSPEIQEKARLDIKQVMAENGNEISYESLKKMKYIKQILLETMRLYPTLHFIPRICRHSTNLNTSNGPIAIPKSTGLIIPTYAIHHNPKFFPNPKHFCPARFEDEEIAKRPSCTFLSFGAGPRGCIGEHFGMMEAGVCLALLLQNFRFSLCDRSPKMLEFDKKQMFMLQLKNEIYLKVEILQDVENKATS